MVEADFPLDFMSSHTQMFVYFLFTPVYIERGHQVVIVSASTVWEWRQKLRENSNELVKIFKSYELIIKTLFYWNTGIPFPHRFFCYWFVSYDSSYFLDIHNKHNKILIFTTPQNNDSYTYSTCVCTCVCTLCTSYRLLYFSIINL